MFSISFSCISRPACHELISWKRKWVATLHVTMLEKYNVTMQKPMCEAPRYSNHCSRLRARGDNVLFEWNRLICESFYTSAGAVCALSTALRVDGFICDGQKAASQYVSGGGLQSILTSFVSFREQDRK